MLQDEWLKTTQYTARASHQIYSKKNVRTRDYNLRAPPSNNFKNGDSMLVWGMRPQVLLAGLMLQISTKIPKCTCEGASDQCSVCFSCFKSFLRVLGA